MADNTTLNAGSGGDVIASDDIGGVKYQRVKLSVGADGSAADAASGGGVESGALRVTIASDSTGVLSVDDNGGSLTVDGTVELGATSLAALESLTTITTVSTVSSVTAIANALPAGTNNIGDVDVLSVVPGTGATNLGKAEDAAHASGDTGVMVLAVRSDSAAASSGTTGDYEPLHTDSSGNLRVSVSAGGVSGIVDDAAFTPATSEGLAVLFFADETATDSVDEGDAGAARMTLDRKQIVTLAPHTQGGPTIFRSIDIDETEEEIKATAGQVYWIHAMNMVATARYLKFYNATAASVTVGTTTPVLTFPIPANSTTGAGFVFNVPQGIPFSTAISVACTTGVADNDTGAPGANDVIINVGYL